jgi:hypothetical protein
MRASSMSVILTPKAPKSAWWTDLHLTVRFPGGEKTSAP